MLVFTDRLIICHQYGWDRDKTAPVRLPQIHAGSECLPEGDKQLPRQQFFTMREGLIARGYHNAEKFYNFKKTTRCEFQASYDELRFCLYEGRN